MNDNISKRKQILVYSGGAVLILALVIIFVSILMSSGRHNSISDQLAQQQKAFASSPDANPILKYLPYGDLGYNIEPTSKIINGKVKLVLIVHVILSGSDYNSTPAELNKIIKADEQAALSYIRSKGFNPAKYMIEYDVPAH
ncbi:MAG TPA: hypothetical protein VFW90_01140 [Candidatus Saccharimonadales bacterium]|nr:hypothetical protein [Candidatus Saccharimonadales bacterium]